MELSRSAGRLPNDLPNHLPSGKPTDGRFLGRHPRLRGHTLDVRIGVVQVETKPPDIRPETALTHPKFGIVRRCLNHCP